MQTLISGAHGSDRVQHSAHRPAAERAQEEGWYRRAIDDALLMVTHRMTVFFEQEVDYMRPPGGERI